MKVIFSPVAKEDLLEIALYIAQDNPTRTLSFVSELEAKSLRLGQTAGIGTPRPELGEGVRMLVHDALDADQAAVIAVKNEIAPMHGARDIGSDDFDVDG